MEENKLLTMLSQVYVTVTSGMEKLSKLEFQEKFQTQFVNFEVFPGKIICSLQTQISVLDVVKKLCSDLKSVEHVFLILYSFSLNEKELEILKESTHADKANISNLILFQEFKENLHKNQQIFLDFLEIYKVLKVINPEKLKFRIDIKENVIPRSEKNELAKLMAEFLEKNFSFLEADLTEYGIKLALEKIDKKYYFSIKLTMNLPLGISQVSALREKTPATMRPSIAYNLCRLLNIEEGDLIIDPMCGSSTIIEIALKEFKQQAFYICSDIDELSIQKSQKNLANYGYVDLVLCNSMRTPFRKNCFNKIITDMPFGKRCGSHHNNLKIYPNLIKEFNRIVSDEGKAVVVTTEKNLIFTNFKKKNGWKREDFFMINKGGLDTFVVVSRKNEFKRKGKKKECEEVKKEENISDLNKSQI